MISLIALTHEKKSTHLFGKVLIIIQKYAATMQVHILFCHENKQLEKQGCFGCSIKGQIRPSNCNYCSSNSERNYNSHSNSYKRYTNLSDPYTVCNSSSAFCMFQSQAQINDTSTLHDWTMPDSQFINRPSLLKVVGINDPSDTGEVRISFGAFLAAGSGELGSLSRTSPDRPRVSQQMALFNTLSCRGWVLGGLYKFVLN